jgi:hypothetical protein
VNFIVFSFSPNLFIILSSKMDALVKKLLSLRKSNEIKKRNNNLEMNCDDKKRKRIDRVEEELDIILPQKKFQTEDHHNNNSECEKQQQLLTNLIIPTQVQNVKSDDENLQKLPPFCLYVRKGDFLCLSKRGEENENLQSSPSIPFEFVLAQSQQSIALTTTNLRIRFLKKLLSSHKIHRRHSLPFEDDNDIYELCDEIHEIDCSLIISLVELKLLNHKIISDKKTENDEMDNLLEDDMAGYQQQYVFTCEEKNRLLQLKDKQSQTDVNILISSSTSGPVIVESELKTLKENQNDVILQSENDIEELNETQNNNIETHKSHIEIQNNNNEIQNNNNEIQNNKIEKAIVYSQWTTMLDLCQFAFEKAEIRFLRFLNLLKFYFLF